MTAIDWGIILVLAIHSYALWKLEKEWEKDARKQAEIIRLTHNLCLDAHASTDKYITDLEARVRSLEAARTS